MTRKLQRLVSLAVLVCFAGNLALAPALAAGAATATSASLGGEAVLSYQGGKLPAELVALAADKQLVKRRAKALYAFVLLRLAHLFVKSPGNAPSDAQTAEAMAPLAQVSLLDVALDIGEFTAASIIAKATETMLLKKYPATTFPAKMVVKVKSYGPIFLAWATINGIQDQVKEGKWRDGFQWSLVTDLARRVGKELLTLVAVTLALKLLGYPFKMLAKVVSEKLLAKFATLRIVTSTVGVWASRALTFANAAGWIVLAVTFFYPLAQKAFAAEETRQLRRLVGQQVRFRTQLTDLLLTSSGEKIAAKLGPGDSRILVHAYISDKDPFAPSKYELLVQLGDANNQLVEEKLKEMKQILLENRRDRETKPAALKKRQGRLDELKREIRSTFGNGKATFLDLDGLDTIGEIDALKREMGRLGAVEREAGNMVILPPDIDELVRRTEQLMKGSLERQRAQFVGTGADRAKRTEEFDRLVQDRMDAVRGLVEEEVVSLKSYCASRLAQIEKLTTQFPTEGEAAAEAAIGEATFEAVNELAGSPTGSAPESAAGFGGLEER
ncbi:MAG: hypothetical protein HY816_01480 [Candidatus Wallbacteria bacterium]|nr:hypothetical protein [Candidatus Wallbacteria bacterium]